VKKNNKKAMKVVASEDGQWTAGLDLGDRWSHYWIGDAQGDSIESGKTKMTPQSLSAHFPASRRMRIALETGTHSNWVRTHLESLGHEVIVANARELRAITGSDRKSDPEDARKLALYVRVDHRILRPVQHRSMEAQQDLTILRAREALVRARTLLINAARGLVKTLGHRLPSCSSRDFAARCREALPTALEASVGKLAEQIESLTGQLEAMKTEIQMVAAKRYPETKRLQAVHGVGPITALTYVLTIEDPSRFRKSRDVGSFLGLRPRQNQSGKRDPQLRITKAGDGRLRSLLVECAHHLLRKNTPDCMLKRWGLRLCERGGKNSRKRALVAVARKLGVLLHKLWVTGAEYDPLFGCPKAEQSAA
jgi:transposase